MFVILDDTGYAQLGCYGSPIETPNFDALAKIGEEALGPLTLPVGNKIWLPL